MHREDHDESCRRGRNYNKLAGFRSEMHQRLSEKVSAQISKIKEIYDDRIIPYENTDDEYCKKLRELCEEWITLGDRIRENGKEISDKYRGGFAALLDLIVGVLGLIKGVAEWQIYSLCGDWGWAPEWLETDINRMKQGVKLIFTDPGQVLETIGQNIFDTADEEGIAYSVGYVTVDIALEILVDKGLDKLKTLNKADDVIGIAEDTARGIGVEYTITYAEAGEDFVKSVESIADVAEDLSQYAYTAEAAGKGLLQHLDDVDDVSRAGNGVAQGGKVAENGTSVLEDVTEGAVNESIVSESGSNSINYTYDPKKIGKQMGKRGWTEEAIQETLDNPVRTVKTRDTRWLPGADGPLDDPATAYYASDGSYVVRNDKTGVITQISNKNDPNWIAPWDVED